ncbi:MAG: hypothetical protein ACJA1B_002006 [Polaribacter sp.]|jgi:hypothetical protein
MKKLLFITILSIIFISCKDQSKEIKKVKLIYSITKIEYANDDKIELFDINFNESNDRLTLEGEVTTLEAYYKVKNALTRNYLEYKNKIRVLPD